MCWITRVLFTAAIAALSSGCGPNWNINAEGKFVSSRGVVTNADPLIYQAAEDRAVEVLSNSRQYMKSIVVDTPDPTKALSGLEVLMEPQPNGIYEEGSGGYARCGEFPRIRLPSEDFTLNGYCHEVLHIATNCADAGGKWHDFWKADGWLNLISICMLRNAP